MGRSGKGQESDYGDGTLILLVQGELDLMTAESLYQRAEDAIERQARLLLLDLVRLSFCDSRGLSAFVRVANKADEVGCRYALIAPRPLVAKVLRITGLDKRLPVFPTIAEARAGMAMLPEAVNS